jgi:hypothetical protein
MGSHEPEIIHKQIGVSWMKMKSYQFVHLSTIWVVTSKNEFTFTFKHKNEHYSSRPIELWLVQVRRNALAIVLHVDCGGPIIFQISFCGRGFQALVSDTPIDNTLDACHEVIGLDRFGFRINRDCLSARILKSFILVVFVCQNVGTRETSKNIFHFRRRQAGEDRNMFYCRRKKTVFTVEEDKKHFPL